MAPGDGDRCRGQARGNPHDGVQHLRANRRRRHGHEIKPKIDARSERRLTTETNIEGKLNVTHATVCNTYEPTVDAVTDTEIEPETVAYSDVVFYGGVPVPFSAYKTKSSPKLVGTEAAALLEVRLPLDEHLRPEVEIILPIAVHHQQQYVHEQELGAARRDRGYRQLRVHSTTTRMPST